MVAASSFLSFEFASSLFFFFLGNIHLLRLWEMGPTEERRFHVWVPVPRRPWPSVTRHADRQTDIQTDWEPMKKGGSAADIPRFDLSLLGKRWVGGWGRGRGSWGGRGGQIYKGVFEKKKNPTSLHFIHLAILSHSPPPYCPSHIVTHTPPPTPSSPSSDLFYFHLFLIWNSPNNNFFFVLFLYKTHKSHLQVWRSCALSPLRVIASCRL